jgi:hypothetical protein
MMDLTLKQRKFIKHYLETGNVSQSALRAGYKHREQGFETLSNLISRGFFDHYLEQLGIDDKLIAQTLLQGLKAMKIQSCNIIVKKDENDQYVASENSNDFLEIEDYATRHRYLETVLKLKKKFVTNKEDDSEPKQKFDDYYISLIRKHSEELDKQPGGYQMKEMPHPHLDKFLSK